MKDLGLVIIWIGFGVYLILIADLVQENTLLKENKNPPDAILTITQDGRVILEGKEIGQSDRLKEWIK